MKYLLLALACTLLLTSCSKHLDVLTGPPVASSFTIPTHFVVEKDFDSAKIRGFNIDLTNTFELLKYHDIPYLASINVNAVRMWIQISHNASNVYSYTKPETIAVVDSAIRLCKKYGIGIMLTMEVLPRQASCDLWGNSTRKAAVQKIWVDLASRYRNEKTIYAYDLINEPRGGTDAENYSMQGDWIKGIRAVDTSHVIAVEQRGNSAYRTLVPYPYKNIIYSPHFYSALALTHQGLDYYQSTGTGNSVRRAYPSSTYPSFYFRNNSYYTDVRNFQLRTGKVIWIGEFSCINWAPKNDKGEWSSTAWIRDAIVLMEEWRWSWSYHCFKGWEGWDARIPSSYYTKFSFKYAAPFTVKTKPTFSEWHSQVSNSSPSMTELKKGLLRNQRID